MRFVGVRNLRDNLSRILEELSEGGEEVVVTNHGRGMARLLPPRRKIGRAELERLWQDIDRTSREISTRWPEGTSAVEAVREERE